uniref:Uncharacterized protein n=1 Tax=Lepeophtheirus salmonis TaxID=72036 RepID=A0A0K2TPB0_LEPSM
MRRGYASDLKVNNPFSRWCCGNPCEDEFTLHAP